MTDNSDNSELLLTAFRYVAGELSVEDAADFETVLAGDQSARDALADVVLLSEAVAVEEFERIHSQPLLSIPPTRRPIPRWCVIAGVCLLAVVGFVVINQQQDAESESVALQPVDSVPLPETRDAHSVLSLWSELGEDEAVPFESDSAEEAESYSTAPNEIPDWMLSALIGSAEPPVDEMQELMDELDHENL